jgi:hypothetical protein
MSKPIPEQQTPLTKEQIAIALAERKALASMLVPGVEPAGQAPAEVLASERATHRYVEPALPPSPPAPVVDIRPAEAAKTQKLDLIAAKVIEIRKAEVELYQQKKNAADLIEQMRLERVALANQKEKLEREVGDLQRSIAAAEAQQLAAQAVRDQAARGEIERLPLKAWQAKWREELIPIVTRIVSGLVKLRAILTDKGATLEQVSALRSPPGLDGNTRSEYIAVSEGAKQILADLHGRIVEHERALAHAEDLMPDPSSPDGKTAINGLRYTLEQVSGIVTNRLVDIPNPRVLPPSSGVEGQTPASLDLAERVSSLLTQYASVQKRANQTSRPMPTITIEILPKGEKPRSEVMRELRGPSKDTFDPTQTRAEGVKE